MSKYSVLITMFFVMLNSSASLAVEIFEKRFRQEKELLLLPSEIRRSAR